MMSIEQIRNALNGDDLNIAQVAADSGVSYPRVVRIKSGKTKNPSYDSVARLSSYLERRGSK